MDTPTRCSSVQQVATDVEAASKPTEPVLPFVAVLRTSDVHDKVLFFFGALGAACAGSVQPAFTLVFGALVNNLGSGTSLSVTLRPIILYFCYLGAAATVSGFMEIFCFEMTGMRQANRIRRQYLTSLLRQDFAFFDSCDTGALMARVVGDTNAIQEAVSTKLPNLLHHSFAGFVGVVIALVRGWKLALVILSTFPLLIASGGVMAWCVTYFTAQSSSAYALASALSKETLSQMRVVAAFGGEKRAVAAYTAALAKPTDAAVWQARASGLAFGCVFFCLFATYALALWYGCSLVLSGQYSGGQVMTVLFASIIGGFSIGQAAPNMTAISAARVAATAAFKVIDREPAIDQAPELALSASSSVAEPPAGAPFVGAVELVDVSFAYPSRPTAPVLTSLSLAFPAGRSMALVGSSGSGKSTVVSLIQRFYDPSSGTVLIDGTDLRSLSLRWVRRHTGLVSQEPALFSGSILENIAYGKDGATAEEIRAAAGAANAASFVEALPQGYDTPCGERGVQLSGGQKQRIAIARAILRNPRILLLDEATSALDSESERVVQAALDKLIAAGGRTSIIIAHRLSTIKDADCIAVMSKGEVVQKGSHAELAAAPGGAYAGLLAAQLGQHYDDLGDRGGEAGGEAGGETPGRDARFATAGFASAAGALSPAKRSADGGSRSAAAVAAPAVVGVAAAGGAVSSFASGSDASGDEKAADKAAPQTKVPFSRLFDLAAHKKGLLPVGVLGSIVNGCVMPAFALALSNIIGSFYLPPAGLRRERDKWCLIFLGIAGGAFVAVSCQMWALGSLGAEVARNARRLAFAAIVRQDAAWFDAPDNASSRLATRLEEDTVHIRGAVADTAAVAMQNLTVLAGGLAIAFAYSWQLTLVILGAMPLMAAASLIQIRVVNGLGGADHSALFATANQLLSDALSNVRTVAAYGLAGAMVDRYSAAQEGPVAGIRKKAYVNGGAFGFGQGMFVFLYALAFWYGGWLVDHGDVSAASVFKVFFGLVFMAMGAAQAAVTFPSLAKAGGAVSSIFKILDRVSLIDYTDASGAAPRACAGGLALSEVVFYYPSRPTVRVLNSISLSFAPGKSTALVGMSGSGKSTVIQLLLRFYDPSGGAVLLDGTDIRSLNLGWLRAQFGLVAQEPALFSGSILDNIAYGKEGATAEEIRAAAGAANAASFVEALPQGYNTPCGERGVQLSGGQKQRIAIARAILRNPRILLLDEATSALDSESERVVQAALDKLIAAGGRTSIIIAHRLSTIRDADCIAVMAKGAVLEQGTHEALVAGGGQYASLHCMQHTGVAVRRGGKA